MELLNYFDINYSVFVFSRGIVIILRLHFPLMGHLENLKILGCRSFAALLIVREHIVVEFFPRFWLFFANSSSLNLICFNVLYLQLSALFDFDWH